jgi:hypothetical protein
VCVLRQQGQKTVTPFKICVHVIQKALVDLADLERVYGFPFLDKDTCPFCFVISVLSPPFMNCEPGTFSAVGMFVKSLWQLNFLRLVTRGVVTSDLLQD